MQQTNTDTSGAHESALEANTEIIDQPGTELSIPNSWGADVLQVENKSTLVAGTSHSESYLAVWQLSPDRTIELKAKNEVGFHPDGVYWVEWDEQTASKELLVAAEGHSQIELWQYSNETLTQLSAIKIEDSPQTLGFSDLDQDGYQDLVVGPYSGERITLLWGSEDNTTFEQMFLASGREPVYPKITDWNLDGYLDIIWSDWRSNTIQWAENKKQRSFQTHLLQEELKSPKEVVVGDINQDSYPDLLVALELGKSALILYGDGNGGILKSESIPSASNGYVTGAIHYDDKNKETMLALAEWDHLVIARRTAPTDAWSYWRTNTLGSIPQAMQFKDIDQDQQVDLIFANSSGQQIEIHYGPIWKEMEAIQF